VERASPVGLARGQPDARAGSSRDAWVAAGLPSDAPLPDRPPNGNARSFGAT